ncbi:MAG: hypothetical protein QXJ17_03965 [Nitrososphaeria archaeon]
MAKTVDISELKKFVIENMPRDSKLRELILCEKDTMTVEDFLSKSDLWFKLLKIEFSK